MAWKPILKAILAVLIPALYTALISKYPNLPLTEAQFVALVLWFIGLFVGGWQASKIHTIWKQWKP